MFEVEKFNIEGLLLFKPKKYSDSRGFFVELFKEQEFLENIGSSYSFVQDNESDSYDSVLRGLHYQIIHPQGKLVRAAQGKIFDVAVDIRKSSPTFGKYATVELSEENNFVFWIPEGFAHGFLSLEDHSKTEYKCSDYWCREGERGILWNDPNLNIQWPLNKTPIVSEKDQSLPSFLDAEYF